MLQKTKNKYTVETLKALNVSYDHDHWLTQADTDMVNAYVELAEGTRSETTPQVGDRLIYTGTEAIMAMRSLKKPRKEDSYPYARNLTSLSYGKKTAISG